MDCHSLFTFPLEPQEKGKGGQCGRAICQQILEIRKANGANKQRLGEKARRGLHRPACPSLRETSQQQRWIPGALPQEVSILGETYTRVLKSLGWFFAEPLFICLQDGSHHATNFKIKQRITPSSSRWSAQ